MEKWSWVRIRNPISTKIELVLEVHPLLPPTKFGADPWTRSWDILRTKTVRTHRQTDTQTDTRRWPQDLAAYGAQVIRGRGKLCELPEFSSNLLKYCSSTVSAYLHIIFYVHFILFSFTCLRCHFLYPITHLRPAMHLVLGLDHLFVLAQQITRRSHVIQTHKKLRNSVISLNYPLISFRL